MKASNGILCILAAIGILVVVIVKNVQFNQNCGGYLKRAADANSVELAKQELQKALKYMEDNELTSGYTSVLWRTPDEDIAFWYNNIKTSYEELCALPETASGLEKSNMLMKLRETLTDEGEKGTTLTKPDGISRYPHNTFWALANTIQVILWIVGLFILYAWLDE